MYVCVCVCVCVCVSERDTAFQCASYVRDVYSILAVSEMYVSVGRVSFGLCVCVCVCVYQCVLCRSQISTCQCCCVWERGDNFCFLSKSCVCVCMCVCVCQCVLCRSQISTCRLRVGVSRVWERDVYLVFE